MMNFKWIKYLIIVFCLFLLTLFQHSFLPFFTFKKIVPNLTFAFFLVIIFFLEKKQNKPLFYFLEIIFYSLVAGFLLDFFSFLESGVYPLFFLITGFLIGKLRSLLRDREDGVFSIDFLFVCIPPFLIYFLFKLIFLSEYYLFVILELMYDFIFVLIFYSIFKRIYNFYLRRSHFLKLYD